MEKDTKSEQTRLETTGTTSEGDRREDGKTPRRKTPRGRGRPPSILVNNIKEDIFTAWTEKDDTNTWPLWIDDIVSGVARLDWYGDRDGTRPLSTISIIRIFINMDTITVAEISTFLNVKISQAKLYMKACQLCYPFFKRTLENKAFLKYPSNTIVSEAHGLSVGYDKQNVALI